jgi:hypothetical protein
MAEHSLERTHATLDLVTRWLQADGEDRRGAVRSAAALLLADYRERWPTLAPVELNRVASTVGAKIVWVPQLSGGARLLPVPGGFRILVSRGLPSAKVRTSIAHELAHTLFYSRAEEVPQQLITANEKEEKFCFDVARWVLAPDWIVEASGIRKMRDPRTVFALLIDPSGPFRLSRPIASRVMLDDYHMATGIAGRWVKKGKWALERSSACASRGLGRKDREFLRSAARRWLMDGTQPGNGDLVIAVPELSGQSAWVVVVRHGEGLDGIR